ncbi:MAG: hypothetical protein QNJ91_05295 [Gammaproteobacteria bacterium]|nr:hypothetical protein [Gammaproteobacteria bacterium]
MDRQPEIQPADPAARRRALRWLLVATALGALLLSLVDGVTRQIDDPLQAERWLYLLIGLLALAGLLMLWPLRRLWRIGGDAIHSRRFPPPGLAVVRATPVLRDAAARRRGRQLQLFALAMALIVLLIPVLLAWMVLRLVGTAGAG